MITETVIERNVEMICQLVRFWTPQDIEVERITSGATNQGFRVDDGCKRWFARIPYEGQTIVDREIEAQNILVLENMMDDLGDILPEFYTYILKGKNVLCSRQTQVFDLPDGTMLTNWIEGHALTAELLKDKSVQEALVSTLHRFHTSEVKFVNIYDPFHNEIEEYRSLVAIETLGLLNSAELAEIERAERKAIRGLPIESGVNVVATHNDLILTNLLLDKNGIVRLLDFEDAGQNVRGYHYDMGTFLGANLFCEPPIDIYVYKEILELAGNVYGKEFNNVKAFYGTLANVLVTFWWGMVQYQTAQTDERKEYFKDYVAKRKNGVKWLMDVLEHV